MLSIALWFKTKNPVLSLYLNIIIDVGAVVPTVIDLWRDPAKEDRKTWLFSSGSTFINLWAVENWTPWQLWLKPNVWLTEQFVIGLYPVLLFLMCSLIFVLTFRPKAAESLAGTFE